MDEPVAVYLLVADPVRRHLLENGVQGAAGRITEDRSGACLIVADEAGLADAAIDREVPLLAVLDDKPAPRTRTVLAARQGPVGVLGGAWSGEAAQLAIETALRNALLSQRDATRLNTLRAAFKASQQIKALLETDGTIVEASDAALTMANVVRTTMIGAKIWDTPWFEATERRAFVFDAVAAGAAGGVTAREIAFGSRSFDFTVRPVCGDDGTILALLAEAREITERRHVEDALRQSQKMEAIGSLTGGVAHDFNNLLTVIMGCLTFLQRRLAHETNLLRMVDGALSASERGAKLTHQLLAFSRKQPLQVVDLDANEVVRGITELLASTVNGEVVLDLNLANHKLPIRADRNQLEMTLLNLVVNARDASARGARVTIETGPALMTLADHRAADGASEVFATDGQARATATIPGVSVTVSDTGSGMSPDILDRCLEPFFTTKPAGAGTGLGLSMVYGFIRQSGGDVIIDTAPGAGTTVQLILPEHHPEETGIENATGSLRQSSGEHILVVEDDADVRALAVMALTQLGYPVTEAENGDAALSMIEAGGVYDMLFTDVVMPGKLDGLALLREARRLRPELNVLLTSARVPKWDGVFQDLGPRGSFLPKPYTPVTLALAIQALFDQ